jgi:hypothetical protein
MSLFWIQKYLVLALSSGINLNTQFYWNVTGFYEVPVIINWKPLTLYGHNANFFQ